MIRNLMVTTVFVVSLSSLSLAQDKPAMPPEASASTAKDQVLASSVIGKTVYTGVDEEGEAIGNVNDVVVNPAGGAQALLIGVGGFLGIGEKNVAIGFDRVSWSERDGQQIIVVAVTKEELQAAPAFQSSTIMDGAVSKEPQGQAVVPAKPPVIQDENAETEIPKAGTTPQMTDPDIPPAAAPDATVSADPSTEEDGQDLQPVDLALLSADKLIGTPVKVADDTQIGTIGDVILSKEGKVEAYVIDVGGFLGIGQKPVVMNAQSVQVMADSSGTMTIYSPFTKAQLEAQPAYDAQSYKTNPQGSSLSNTVQ